MAKSCGSSLLEVLVSIALIATASGALLSLLPSASRSSVPAQISAVESERQLMDELLLLRTESERLVKPLVRVIAADRLDELAAIFGATNRLDGIVRPAPLSQALLSLRGQHDWSHRGINTIHYPLGSQVLLRSAPALLASGSELWLGLGCTVELSCALVRCIKTSCVPIEGQEPFFEAAPALGFIQFVQPISALQVHYVSARSSLRLLRLGANGIIENQPILDNIERWQPQVVTDSKDPSLRIVSIEAKTLAAPTALGATTLFAHLPTLYQAPQLALPIALLDSSVGM